MTDDNEFNSPAAAFSHQGKGNYQDLDVRDGWGDTEDTDAYVHVDAPDDFAEAARSINAAATDGDFRQARLEAAKVIGMVDEEAVEEARERIETQYPTGMYGATAEGVRRDADKLELNAGSGHMVNVASLAIKIVESINARDE